MLLAHREAADVAAGRFRLSLDIGSRQWGGSTWDLDLNIGSLGDDGLDHDGDITWEIRKAGVGGTDNPRARILAAVVEAPGEHGKEELAKAAGGRLTDARRLVDAVENAGQIWQQRVPGTRADGRSHHSWKYFPTIEAGT
jgi:hypothetical protein